MNGLNFKIFFNHGEEITYFFRLNGFLKFSNALGRRDMHVLLFDVLYSTAVGEGSIWVFKNLRHCWGMKNFTALLGYEKLSDIVGVRKFSCNFWWGMKKFWEKMVGCEKYSENPEISSTLRPPIKNDTPLRYLVF